MPYSTISGVAKARAASAHAARSASNSPATMRSSVKTGSVTSGCFWLRIIRRMKGTAPPLRIQVAVPAGKARETDHSVEK